MPTSPYRVIPFPPPAASLTETTGEIFPSEEDALRGPGEVISRVRSQLSRVSPYFRAVVLYGESGTGTKAVARRLHRLSPASGLAFLPLDAPAAEQLARDGAALALAGVGTVLLRHVEELSLEAQHWFLRRLRQRANPIRLVASAQTDLRACVSAGRFSLDFADALSAIRIAMPPLRERPEDLADLVAAAARRLGQTAECPGSLLTESFLAAAADYTWPGNLPELDAVLSKLFETFSQEPCTAEDLRAALAGDTTSGVRNAKPTAIRLIRLEDVQQEHIRGVLIACHGNKLRAAEVLGISRSTLYRMLDSYTSARLPLAS